MSDEKSPETSAPPVTPSRTIESPMTSWVRGGSLTSAYEAQLAQQKANAQAARDLEDRRAAKAEDGSGEAKQFRHVVGGNKKYPGIVLEVREPRDNKVLDYVECELHVLDDGTLMLQLCCAWCFHRAGITENFNIRQTHRHFELDARRSGEIWVNPKPPYQVVTLAGTIQMTESFTCPNLGCGKRFVIDNSVVREK